MRFGFNIGFPVSAAPCAMVHSPNHPSAFKNSAFVSDYLTSKSAAGETAGPFSSPPFCVMHISGLGVVPKHNGKLRLTHDLSSPTGVSVNDGISRDLGPGSNARSKNVTQDHSYSALTPISQPKLTLLLYCVRSGY